MSKPPLRGSTGNLGENAMTELDDHENSRTEAKAYMIGVENIRRDSTPQKLKEGTTEFPAEYWEVKTFLTPAKGLSKERRTASVLLNECEE